MASCILDCNGPIEVEIYVFVWKKKIGNKNCTTEFASHRLVNCSCIMTVCATTAKKKSIVLSPPDLVWGCNDLEFKRRKTPRLLGVCLFLSRKISFHQTNETVPDLLHLTMYVT
jgi:hypothetical protein